MISICDFKQNTCLLVKHCLGFSNGSFMLLAAYFDLWNHAHPSHALKDNSSEFWFFFFNYYLGQISSGLGFFWENPNNFSYVIVNLSVS